MTSQNVSSQALRVSGAWGRLVASSFSLRPSAFRLRMPSLSLHNSEIIFHNSHLPLFKPFRIAAYALITAFCLLPSELHAQGCAMCYTSASAAQSTAKQALANGTLILFLPPMVIIAIITVVLFKYRNKYRDPSFFRSSESTIRNPISTDAEPASGIPPEESLQLASELRCLENDGDMVAVDHGSTDKLYQR